MGWALRGFFAGTAIGVVFGLVTYSFWDLIGPFQVQISAGFWGLLFGVVGLIIGLIVEVVRGKWKDNP